MTERIEAFVPCEHFGRGAELEDIIRNGEGESVWRYHCLTCRTDLLLVGQRAFAPKKAEAISPVDADTPDDVRIQYSQTGLPMLKQENPWWK